MTRWTQDQYDAWVAKQALLPPYKDPKEIPDKGPESRLAGKIKKFCDDHGYPCQCFRQSKKAKGFLVPGLPD